MSAHFTNRQKERLSRKALRRKRFIISSIKGFARFNFFSAIILLALMGTVQQVAIDQPFYVKPANAAGEKWSLHERGKNYEIWRDDNFQGVGARFRYMSAPEWIYDSVTKQYVPYIMRDLGNGAYQIQTTSIGVYISPSSTKWYDPTMTTVRVNEEKWLVKANGQTLIDQTSQPSYTFQKTTNSLTVTLIYSNKFGKLTLTYHFPIGGLAKHTVKFQGTGTQSWKTLQIIQVWNGIVADKYILRNEVITFLKGKEIVAMQNMKREPLFQNVTVNKQGDKFYASFLYSKNGVNAMAIDPDVFTMQYMNSGTMEGHSDTSFEDCVTNPYELEAYAYYEQVGRSGYSFYWYQSSYSETELPPSGSVSGYLPYEKQWATYSWAPYSDHYKLTITYSLGTYTTEVWTLKKYNEYGRWISSPERTVYHGYLSFDTSLIPDNAYIEEARLRTFFNATTQVETGGRGGNQNFTVQISSASGSLSGTRNIWNNFEDQSNLNYTWNTYYWNPVGYLPTWLPPDWYEYTLPTSNGKCSSLNFAGLSQFKLNMTTERVNVTRPADTAEGIDKVSFSFYYYQPVPGGGYVWSYSDRYSYVWQREYTLQEYQKFEETWNPDLSDFRLVITWIDPAYVITMWTTVTTTLIAAEHKPIIEDFRIMDAPATIGDSPNFRLLAGICPSTMPVVCAEKMYNTFRIVLSDPDGPDNLKELWVNLEGYGWLKVKWTRPNTFTEEFDPDNNIEILLGPSGGCKATKSGDQYIVEFKIKFNWNYPYGNMAHYVRLKAVDNYGFETISYQYNAYMVAQSLVVPSAYFPPTSLTVTPSTPAPSGTFYLAGNLRYRWAESISPSTGFYNVTIYYKNPSGAFSYRAKQTTIVNGAFNISVTAEALSGNYSYAIHHLYPYTYLGGNMFFVIVGKMPVEIWWKQNNVVGNPSTTLTLSFKVRFATNASAFKNLHGTVYINSSAASFDSGSGEWRLQQSRSDIVEYHYIVTSVYHSPSNTYCTISDLVGAQYATWTRLKLTALKEGMANIYYILPTENVQLQLKVTFWHNNAPINNAKVEIIYNGAVQSTGYTNASGIVTFNQAPISADSFQFVYKAYEPAGGYGLNTESVTGKKFYLNYLVISGWETSGDTSYATIKYTAKSKLGVTSYNWGYILLAGTGSKNITFTIDDVQGQLRLYQLYVSRSRLSYGQAFTATLTVHNIGTSGLPNMAITANIMIRYKQGYYVDQWNFPFDYIPPAAEINSTYVGQFGRNSTNPLPERNYPLLLRLTCTSESISFTTRELDFPILLSSDDVYVKQYLMLFEGTAIQRSVDWYSIQATSGTKFYLQLVDENLLVPYPQYKPDCDIPSTSDILISVTVFPTTVESTLQVNVTIVVSNNQTKPVYAYTTILSDGVYYQWNLTQISTNITLTYSWPAPAAEIYDSVSKFITVNVYTKTGVLMKSESINYIILNKPPTIALVSPEQTETLTGNKTIDLNIYDASGIRTAMYRWNDEPQWLQLSSPYDIPIDTNRFENGRNFLKIKATDMAGNPAETTFYFIIGNEEPEAMWIAAVKQAIALFAQIGFFPAILLSFLLVIAGVWIGYMRAKPPQPQTVVVPKKARQPTTTTRYELALPKDRAELIERVKREEKREMLY